MKIACSNEGTERIYKQNRNVHRVWVSITILFIIEITEETVSTQYQVYLRVTKQCSTLI